MLGNLNNKLQTPIYTLSSDESFNCKPYQFETTIIDAGPVNMDTKSLTVNICHQKDIDQYLQNVGYPPDSNQNYPKPLKTITVNLD